MKAVLLSTICLSVLLSPAALIGAVGSSQVVRLTDSLGIPGGTLKPGTFTFSVEDQLSDRTIVRITSGKGSKHYLLLTVPTQNQTQPDSNGLSYFTAGDEGKRSLRTWKCNGCSTAVEFVYPKLEAVQITDSSTEPVLAVDPASDKLPSNLSSDDMKVVTLWTLSPERISGNKGTGVKAAKYEASNAPASTTQVASAAPPPVAPETSQVLSSPKTRMPKTASHTFEFALCGFMLLAGASTLRVVRVRKA